MAHMFRAIGRIASSNRIRGSGEIMELIVAIAIGCALLLLGGVTYVLGQPSRKRKSGKRRHEVIVFAPANETIDDP